MNSKDEWGTPEDLFKALDEIFNFTLDPCGTHKRRLKPADQMHTYETNGLKAPWKNHTVFVNPPYSGNNIKKWIMKCFQERHSASSIVLLIPASKIGTHYFQEYALPWVEIQYVTGRLKFVPLAGQKTGSNPQYSIICIWQSCTEHKDLSSIEQLRNPSDFEEAHT